MDTYLQEKLKENVLLFCVMDQLFLLLLLLGPSIIFRLKRAKRFLSKEAKTRMAILKFFHGVSLPLPLSQSHYNCPSISFTLNVSLSLLLTFSVSLSLSQSLSLWHSLCLSQSLSFLITVSPSLSLTHSLSHSLSIYLLLIMPILSVSYTLCLFNFTNTLYLTLSRSLLVSLSYSLSLFSS